MIRSPSEIEARELFLSTGVRFADKGDYYSIFCPFHSNTKTASAVLYKDKWLFKCFGCNTIYSFTKLYETLKGKPWDEHGEFSMIPIPVKDTMSADSRRAFEIEEGRVTSIYDNAKALEYCRSREVSDEFMQFFNFQATDLCQFKKLNKDDLTSIWRDRLLIPITVDGRPFSLEGRDYTRKQIPKCLYPKHCKTDTCFNQDNLDKANPLIVCEGIMDIHKIWSSIDKNVTCTFGVTLSDAQKRYLKNIPNIILFIDDDPAGHGSVSTFEKFMECDFKVALVPGTDPGAANEYQLKKALEKAVPWVDFLMEDVKLFENSARSSFSLAKSRKV
jgi:DNA primase